MSYPVFLPNNPNVTGIITFETQGSEKKAIIKVEGNTESGQTLNITTDTDFISSPTDEELIQEVLLYANNELYNEVEKLQVENISNIDNSITEDENILDEPRFNVFTTNENVIGEIYFYALEDGYYGELKLSNFPDGYIKSYILGTPPISNPNYEELKIEAIKQGQEYLDSLKTDEIDFGTLKEGTKEIKYFYKIRGRVVDIETQQSIGGANIISMAENDSSSTTSDPDGIFLLEGQYEVEENTTKSLPFEVDISFKDYNTVSIPVVTLEGKIKDNLSIIQLTPIIINTEKEQLEIENFSPDQEKLLKKENRKDFITKLTERLINQIKTKLIPSILLMIGTFGASGLEKLSKKKNLSPKDLKSQALTCPADIEGLNIIIAKKNKLTKQLNALNRGINQIVKFLGIPPKIISGAEKGIGAAKIAVNTAAFIPSTSVTPVPVGPILIAKDVIEFLEDLIDKQKAKLGPGEFQLNFLKSEIQKVVNLLGLLDSLIEKCGEELGLENGNNEEVSNAAAAQVAASTEEQSNQLSPVVTNVNGFDMDVINVDNVTIGGIKRRRAIARNKAGVIMLQGEPSFSSNDQILIDELVFYIQQNDLKAE